MRDFIKNIVLFSLVSILFIESISVVMLYSKINLLYIYPAHEVYYSIFKSKQRKKSKVLILGDSVGSQLFPNNTTKSNKINSLACNQAIGIAGQYFLLNNYLLAGNKIDTVYLIYNPISFKNNLHSKLTFNYFLKPFYNDEYEFLFTNAVKKQIKKIPYYNLSQIPNIKISIWSPDFNPYDIPDYSFLSPVSVENMKKIRELSYKYKFKLIVLPPPISINNKVRIEKINREEIKINKLEDVFNNYFNNIIYLDGSKFKDGIHLISPKTIINIYKNKIMRLK